MTTANELFTRYCSRIEGYIPDLCGEEPDHDSIYCFACDYIFDRERTRLGAFSEAHDEIKAAADKIATYYAG